MAFGSGLVASRSQPQCREHGVSIDCTPVVPVVKTKEVTHGRPMAASSGPRARGPAMTVLGTSLTLGFVSTSTYPFWFQTPAFW